jgi:UDP-glucose 4-epimerase
VRVLVTGAAGFIGSHLADRLVADGHEVIGIDDMSSGHNTPEHTELHRMDVADPALATLVAERRPEVICHLAAQVSVRVSVGDPARDARVNVLGTVNVLEAARAAGARKVVFTSSCAVYGVPTCSLCRSTPGCGPSRRTRPRRWPASSTPRCIRPCTASTTRR